MRAIVQRDGAAFAVLLERHMEKVRALAWRMLGNIDEADDIAQEVFLRIWRKPNNFRPDKGWFTAWLHRVAANACIDRLRKKNTASLDDGLAERLSDDAPDPERHAIEAERSERVRRAIAALPERQRLAIVLAHYMGHTNIETAQIMESTVEAVESLLGRARRRLKTTLAKELGELVPGRKGGT